jgi:hypothetical protein
LSGSYFDAWGRRHTGEYGAAGLLIRHREEGTTRYLLQRHTGPDGHAGMWSIPTAALRLDDGSVEAGALRAGREALGPLPHLRPVTSVVYDYGGWQFHTVVVDALAPFSPSAGAESRWWTAEEFESLHPDFATMWPRVHAGIGGPPLDECVYFGPPPPVEVVGYGWRSWQVTNRGRLVSPLTVNGGLLPWPPNGSVRAVWEKNGAHRAPGDGCECGLRVLPRYADFHDAIAAYGGGLASVMLMAWLELTRPERRTPTVIGRVAYWGRVLPGAEDPLDPPGTVRAEYAAVGTDLYVGRHLEETARAIRSQYPGVQVHVGRQSGMQWLNEIAAHVRE